MKLDAFDFSTLDLLHEHLGVDFANTIPITRFDEDHLNGYADLLSWSLDVNIMTEDEAMQLLALANRQPDKAAAVHQSAIRLREAIFNILVDVARQQTPDSDYMDSFNTALGAAMTHMQLVPQDGVYGWGWIYTEDDLDQMLWPVAWSTAQLLRSEDHARVKQCEADDCQWLFLDTSRNHSRRWCDMKTCGNRVKARRFYQRSKDTD